MGIEPTTSGLLDQRRGRRTTRLAGPLSTAILSLHRSTRKQKPEIIEEINSDRNIYTDGNFNVKNETLYSHGMTKFASFMFADVY